jgi:heme a synthase
MQTPPPIRLISTWLWSGIVLVSLMVLIGGITRLTGSGLSIVEWKPISGTIPPLTEAQWQQEFDAYKQFPEYQKINYGLTLDDFKGIFWWEYIHRLLGRLTGLVFLLPFGYFLYKGWVSRPLLKRLLLILLLGALQGLMGWLMVKSGLQELPHVSHYRLAAHLGLALLLIAVIVWTLLELNQKHHPQKGTLPAWYYPLAQGLVAVVFIQILLGAFVAGLKAGFSYNSFPLMGDSFFPAHFYTSPSDLFSSGPLVQFLHRWFAFVVLALAGFFYYTLRQEEGNRALKLSSGWLLLGLGLQTLLGIATLLLQVPLLLGVLHQLVAVLLVVLGVRVLFQLRQARHQPVLQGS